MKHVNVLILNYNFRNVSGHLLRNLGRFMVRDGAQLHFGQCSTLIQFGKRTALEGKDELKLARCARYSLLQPVQMPAGATRATP